jgi:hypothetical protein
MYLFAIQIYGEWAGHRRMQMSALFGSLFDAIQQFGEYAQQHSDKTAKTGFVGFGITCLGVSGILL